MIKNKMWEALYKIKLPCNQRRVWDYIYRQTEGWGGGMKEISTYKIAKDLRILGSTVRAIIRALIKKRMIIVKGKDKGIQTDFNLWKVGQEKPNKEVGQEKPNSRLKKVHLVGQEKPLIKETLKEKKKDRGLSASLREEKLKEFKKGLKMMKEAIGKVPDKKEKKAGD